MYWAFYKSTVVLNICVSGMVAFLTREALLVTFPICFATVGLLVAFLYKEIARKMEYYFYFNRGISKIKLMLFCFMVNVLLALPILFIVFYVTSS